MTLLFSLFTDDLTTSLPFYISSSLYANKMIICSSSPLVPVAAEPTQGALIRWECWSAHWCLPLNSSNHDASLFPMDLHQANLRSNLSLFLSPVQCNSTPTFLFVTFDCTLSFSAHVSSPKAKFFLCAKVFAVTLLPLGVTLRSSFLFLGPFSLMLH